MSPIKSVPVSVRILQEQGPMSLRELSSETAKALDARIYYDDLDAVLRSAQKRGEVRIRGSAGDFRNVIWEST